MNAPARIPHRAPRPARVRYQGQTLWTEGRPLAERDRWAEERSSRWLIAAGWAAIGIGPIVAFLLGLLLVLPE
jgi:hypothetical protein